MKPKKNMATKAAKAGKPVRAKLVNVRGQTVRVTGQTTTTRRPTAARRTPATPRSPRRSLPKLPTWILWLVGILALCAVVALVLWLWPHGSPKNAFTPVPVVSRAIPPVSETTPPVATPPQPSLVINITNSSGVNVNVSTGGGTAQQQVISTSDNGWMRQPPTRRAEVTQADDTVQPGEYVEYHVPKGYTANPIPVGAPQEAIRYYPVNPLWYNGCTDNWDCRDGRFCLWVTADWRNPVMVDFNLRPAGTPLKHGGFQGQGGRGGCYSGSSHTGGGYGGNRYGRK